MGQRARTSPSQPPLMIPISHPPPGAPARGSTRRHASGSSPVRCRAARRVESNAGPGGGPGPGWDPVPVPRPRRLHASSGTGPMQMQASCWTPIVTSPSSWTIAGAWVVLAYYCWWWMDDGDAHWPDCVVCLSVWPLHQHQAATFSPVVRTYCTVLSPYVSRAVHRVVPGFSSFGLRSA